MKPALIIGQNNGTAESRAVAMAAMLLDIECRPVSLEVLPEYESQLRSGTALPVGSVEFVREAMRVGNFEEPANMSYPEQLRHLLRRNVQLAKAGSVLGFWFIKPVQTKAFTGFVFDTRRDPCCLSEHDREQYDAFVAMPADAAIWLSEPVFFVSEWRYYITRGEIVGCARYDPDGADDAPAPDATIVQGAVATMTAASGADLTCALDFGVLASGETALVEVNDGWSLGLYGRSLEPKVYLDLLFERWQQLLR